MARRLTLLTLMMALAAGAATAQDVRQYRAGDAVDPRDVAAILGQPAAPVIKMRSIRLLDDAAPAPQGSPLAAAGAAANLAAAAQADAATTEAAPRRQRAAALSLPVQFGFDSSDILPSARHQLDALAEGIRLLPAAQAVVIEGHTDAAGSDQYNETLSLRRALVVKRYLVLAHGLEPTRLRAVGMGEYAPLAGLNPHAAENRRVQFRGE